MRIVRGSLIKIESHTIICDLARVSSLLLVPCTYTCTHVAINSHSPRRRRRRGIKGFHAVQNAPLSPPALHGSSSSPCGHLSHGLALQEVSEPAVAAAGEDSHHITTGDQPVLALKSKGPLLFGIHTCIYVFYLDEALLCWCAFDCAHREIY